MAKAKKLPSGNWRVQASKTINGEKKVKSFTATTKKEAELLAIEWQYNATETTVNNPILKDAYNRYIEAKEKILSPSTIKNYIKLMNNSLQDIMDLPIYSLTTETIQKSINMYSANHSPKSVRNCSGLLSAVLKMFRPEFKMTIALPQKEKHEVYIPTDNEIKSILVASSNTNLYIPILLAAYCGMRDGEICALTSTDINDGFLTVNKSMVNDRYGKWQIKPPKTFSSNRNIEMPQIVKKALQGKCGKIVAYNPHSLSQCFRKFLKANNFNLFSFHKLRHYYVSTLYDLNIPEKYIISQVGHSTNSLTRAVYDHKNKNKQTEYNTLISQFWQ